MADESSKKYVLEFDVPMTQLLQSVKLAEKSAQSLQNTFKKTGSQISKVLGGTAGSFKTSQAIDSTTGKVKNLGKEVSVASAKVKLVNGQIGTYTKTTKRMKDGTTQVTGAFKQASTATESYGEAMGRLFKRAIVTIPVWLLLRSGLMAFNKLLKSSIKFLIDWEYQMAQIAIVGNSTAEQLSTLSGALIQIGRDFGISIKDLGEASKLWSQQGRAIEEIIPLMRTTAKLSLITGQTTSKAVEDLTAVLKAYRIEARDSINIVDSMTNVMTRHAITAKDLASAYKQVASTASSLGVTFEELTGYITAIKAVTRDSGSKIGLSLRTMFSRITTSSAKAIQNLSSVPLYLDTMGRATFAVTPRMRSLGDIISELSLKFGSLGNAQKSQLATLIGGVRRQNQVFALFDNFTESVKAQTDAMFGLGKASSAINILTNTSKIGIDKLKNSWFSFVESVADSDVIKTVIDNITNAVKALDKALAPDKFAYKETLDSLNKQNDAYSRQGKYADAVSEVLKQINQLENQSVRATEEQNKIINDRANLYRKAFNEASKIAGVEFRVGETGGLAGLSTELLNFEEQAKQIKFDTIVGQKLVALKTEALSTGQSIAQVLDELASVKVSAIRFKIYDKDDRKELDEIYQLFTKIADKVQKGINVPDPDFKKITKHLKNWNLLTDAEQVNLEILLNQYTDKNELLSNETKVREDIVKQIETEKKYAEDIVLDYKKQQIINKVIVKDQLERMKVAGALNSEILKAEGYLIKQLGIEEKIESRLNRQLALEREKTKEQRLQGQLGSDSIKLFEIAKSEGVDIAKKIGAVLSGDTSFTTFVRKGGKALEVFKDKFADIFKQKQAESFFKGERVPGLKGLRGGAGISISEELQPSPQRFNAEAERKKLRLLEQERKAIVGVPVVQTTITAPVNLTVTANVDISKISEVSNKVISEVTKQLPQAGTKLNKALTKAIYNKQTNSL